MTARKPRQFDLFQYNDTPDTLPKAIEATTLDLLVQLMEAMVPVIEAEVSNEQDHS